jgi:hypothetical protein
MKPMLDMLNHNSRVKTSARVNGASRFLHGFVSVDNVEKNIESFRVRMMQKSPVGLVVDSTGSLDNIFNQMSLTDLRVKSYRRSVSAQVAVRECVAG